MKVVLNKDAQDVDGLIRKFKKLTMKEGIVYECKRRAAFQTKAERRREKSKRARIRAKRK